MVCLGIDSSNYRSSAAAVFDDFSYISERKLLSVDLGKRGLRQSDAVFLHTRQLPDVLTDVLKQISVKDISAVSVSSKPRNIAGSYMPCFLSGLSLGKTVSAVLNVPLFEFSHQEGHIAAALLSSNRQDLFNKKFIAFHLSGGTTEALLVTPDSVGGFNSEIVGKTLDINAGQVIDRVGVMLGLEFPSGPRLETMALNGIAAKGIKPCVKGTDCALSGAENFCKNLLLKNESPNNIAASALEYVVSTVVKMTEEVLRLYGELPLVFSGGVVANKALRQRLSERFEANFASLELSGDNAVGTALLGKKRL